MRYFNTFFGRILYFYRSGILCGDAIMFFLLLLFFFYAPEHNLFFEAFYNSYRWDILYYYYYSTCAQDIFKWQCKDAGLNLHDLILFNSVVFIFISLSFLFGFFIMSKILFGDENRAKHRWRINWICNFMKRCLV